MMFPMIPQYFFSKPIECTNYDMGLQKISDGKNSVKVKKKCKIIVSGVIEADVESGKIVIDELLDAAEDELEEIQVYSEDNILKCKPGNWSWLKQVHLAEDCHSCNMILYQDSPASILKIKTVRKILPEEKLVLWFSRELLLILQIPFLLPNNILSEKQYICHKCRFQCEMPNPIKIHLALDCGKFTKSTLWNRLKELAFTGSSLKSESCDRFESKKECSPSPPNSSLFSDIKPEITNLSNSAFKPYKKISKETISDTKVTNDKVKMCSVVPNVLSSNDIIPELNEANVLYKRAFEMESIVSNLGRFKQGHLCIYCGKVYSRKYGLKIHIRTHTGFKPLKCKFCSRPFGDPSNLNKHVRLHSEGDTPYKCEQCGKILVRKRDLDRHMKSRH